MFWRVMNALLVAAGETKVLVAMNVSGRPRYCLAGLKIDARAPHDLSMRWQVL
jgi:hypothetical protein